MLMVMIQRILMTVIIRLLLNLLSLMAVNGHMLQILDDILKVFVHIALILRHGASPYRLVNACSCWAHS